MSCSCNHNESGEQVGADGSLPTASLDDVAAQIRREFAEQTPGTAEAFEAATKAAFEAERAAKQKKKTISQATFDEVVEENVEEFGLDLEEAMKDAVEQFKQQGVDLSALVTTPAEREIDQRVKAEVSGLEEALKDPACSGESLEPILDHLAETCRLGPAERKAAGRHGAVGAASFVCKKLCADEKAVVAALRLLKVLAQSFANREVFPLQGAEAVVECLAHHEDVQDVQHAGFEALAQFIAKHEANKRNLKDAKVNARVLSSLRTHAEDPNVVASACRFVRGFLSDDDRRPGVQPGTFVRARELGEDYHNGLLQPLVAILASEATLAEETQVASLLATLRIAAVNDLICKNFANEGGLDAALVAFEAYVTEELVAAQACMLLMAVSRNDDIKRTVGKGKGLGLLLRAMETHAASPRVAEQALSCLSVLCLRQPENCEKIASLGCLQLICATMMQFPDAPGVQRQAISTLRNMVSSWQNKDLCGQILDQNAEDLIRKARAAHPICEEVAYAALRDLGLSYHA
ncbi:Armadillo repeat-containing protein 6 [Hondaea fermentalgiana]|uniref:Armadillo repeat-containing protein 6 n=1 Tax=Hondaea fermentalgiana TaxID=2315210 RepID=A0A2R5G238_9STRA|nr:Armadillo repeat-containing protein 6 [Hondaea fermentalgiana]|eukprot:GBG25076.1 Armadillo repeat-containing protein 6 [Hondaea fermentalgiana]